MRGLGLVVIAVVSGLVWFYVTDDSSDTPANTGGESTTPEPGGVYQFTAHEKMPRPNKVDNCADHAYRDVETFLKNTRCDHLARQLFVTEVDGRTIYTSVSVVTMQNEHDAQELRDLTDTDGSGNVKDVVKDELVKIDGLSSLSRADGYKSKQIGQDVIIVESDFDPKDATDKNADEKILDKVCDDALVLSDKVNNGSGAG
jgi:hypothetical protein